MGRGNPESADAVIARETDVFVADTPSETNKTQLNQLKVHWVELRTQDGYQKFEKVLKALAIPNKPLTGNVEKAIDNILKAIPDEVIDEMSKEIEDPIKEAT